MQNFIKITIYLIASLLLLSCLSSCTDEEKNTPPEETKATPEEKKATDEEKIATYYTFVMYKAPDESQWKLPSKAKAEPGSYRFQIVYLNPYEDKNLPWIALRGEFEFEKDTQGGIKLEHKYTLDKITADAFDNIIDKGVSLWSKNSWKENGRKWVQPLIIEMDKSVKTGDPDPNFIRFLIQKTVEDSWNDNGNKYNIYRLHYFKNNKPKNQIEIISRFIQPSQTPTDNITRLKGWVDQQKNGFTSAYYLGKPDSNHQQFFQNFKIFFNNQFDLTLMTQPHSSSSTIQTKDKTQESTNNSNWTSIIFSILFVVIITIITIAFYFQDQLKLLYIKYRKTDYKFGDDFDDNSQENTQPPAYLNINQDNRESAFDNVSINEFNQLKNELQLQINNLTRVQNELQTNSYNTQATPAEIDDNKLSQFVEMAVKKYLDKNLGNYLNLHLKSYIENQPTPSQPLSDKQNEIQPYTPPTTTPKPPQKPTDNTITQIKTLLLSNKSVDDEAALNSLNTNVDPCTFITTVVGNCLKLNQPLTHYQRLNDAIKNLTNNKVSLLIPNVGEDVNTVEHNVVSQQTVSKGKLNTVANLIRPGVKCDAVIKRKAEVVQNV